MTVAELIAELQKMPGEKTAAIFTEGVISDVALVFSGGDFQGEPDERIIVADASAL